ncbi:hypothetical protein HYPSUDRAFT_61555 [Hypholoma sublateritium FD-334 SS-4]|uniref:Uncharacterized protein n=1 Tax=Hypholoma sublateritium (strain FD-334 SS-4) TaxID=945553 RepID=A0A0D2MXD4_HYPSF|nr:hypothetical protein HYPSUDRAFT_61555 [Hypholoma sublateritium FD-334 SS-4]
MAAYGDRNRDVTSMPALIAQCIDKRCVLSRYITCNNTMSFPPDNKTESVLPTSITHPLNVSPGPQMYVVQGKSLFRPVHKGPSTVRRVLRGLLFISVSLAMFHWIRPSRFICFRGHRNSESPDMHDGTVYEIPSDIVTNTCIQGSEWTDGPDNGQHFKTARTSFEIPLSADNIFFVSRGSLSAGLIEFVTSADQPKDSVTVNVIAEYHREYIRDLAKACLVSRDGNQQGVGLFTPIWPYGRRTHGREDSMHFTIEIVFPDFSDDKSAAPVKSFETDVPNTAQFTKFLKSSKLSFESIVLKGTNAPIVVESLSAAAGSVTTTNAGIRGKFYTTTALLLKTSNSPIQVDVELHSNSTEPTLVAHTSNGVLDATLHLTSSVGSGGKFDISTATSNSPLSVVFQDAPLDSTVAFDGKTSNARAHAVLHPSYEGSFDIMTSNWFQANVNLLPAADPSGKERKRGTVVQHPKMGHAYGSTSWVGDGGAEAPPGKVDIRTSNSDVILDISGR